MKVSVVSTFHLFNSSHHVKPHMPKIPGMELFEGRKIHSRSFRYEEQFDGLNVAILGGNFSGMDIAMHVAQYAQKVRVVNAFKFISQITFFLMPFARLFPN